jgi:hypothetical protein
MKAALHPTIVLPVYPNVLPVGFRVGWLSSSKFSFFGGASIANEEIWTFEDLQPKTDTKNGSQKMGKETWREEKRRSAAGEAGNPGNRTQEAFKARAPAHPPNMYSFGIAVISGHAEREILHFLPSKAFDAWKRFP